MRLKSFSRSYKHSRTSERIEKSPTATWGKFLVLLIILAWTSSFVVGFENSLMFLTLLGFVGAVVGLRFPFIGLLGIGMLSTLDAITRFMLTDGGFLRWNSLNYWLIVVIILYLPFILRLIDPHSRILQVFSLLLGLGLLISSGMMEGVQDILNIVAIFGLIVYFARAVHDKEIFFWFGVVNGILAAVGGLVYYLQIDLLPYMDPNSWSYFPLTAMFSICLAFSCTVKNRRDQLLLLFLIITNFIWIYLSGSRGNLLTGLCCFIYLILVSRSLSWSTFLLITAIILGYWLSTIFVEQQIFALSRLEKTFGTSLTLAERTSGRSTIALGGWQLFLDNPLGVGTGGFRQSFASAFMLGERPAHSGWVKILVENGIIGLTLLISYVVSFLVVAWRKTDLGYKVRLLGFLVTAVLILMFISTEFQGKSLWLLVAGVTVLLHDEDMIRNVKMSNRHKLTRKYYHKKVVSQGRHQRAFQSGERESK